MGIRNSLLLAALIIAATFGNHSQAADDVARDSVATWQDDATLFSMQWIGPKIGYAVGAQGVIWKTVDGGRSWQRVASGVTCSLRSVCFLDDQLGWVAGFECGAAGLKTGVVLSTQDGGRSWERLGEGQLPPIAYVKFFSLEEGVLVGRGSSELPSGMMRTTDGGKTWQPLNGNVLSNWRTACFVAPDMGVAAGPEGRLTLIGGDNLLASKLPPQGLRTIRAVSIQSDDTGWLAGDGGLVLSTSTGGVVWESPPTSMPEELRQGIDFRTLALRGTNVWLAGSPGGVVWHSPNRGRTWQRYLTGQPVPINSIHFANDSQGVAVGELGVILRTEDGGQTWQTVQGAGRRVAVLSLQARPSQVTWAWLAKLAGEEGYRSAVWIANRQDIGPASRSVDIESRLRTAVEQSGGNASDIYWQLPVTVPGLEFAPDKLIGDWQKRTEGKLAPSVLGLLVRQLRTWRPNIVIVDQPARDDAASQLLFDAALRAVEQAADSTRFIEHRDLTGLSPWKVDRIYLQLGAGETGDAKIDLDEYMPRRRMSVRLAAATGNSLMKTNGPASEVTSEPPRLAYRWIGLDGRRSGEAALARDFFNGISLPPGSDARRELASIDEASLERMQKLVQRHRNFQAIADKTLDDPRMAGQMIGQLGNVVRDMQPRQGAEVLRGLADEYRERSLFELVEMANMELVRRYPQEPAAIDAMRWLLQFWISSETAWQRTRNLTSTTTRMTTGSTKANAKLIQQAADTLSQGLGGVNTANLIDDPPPDVNQTTRPGRLNRVNVPPNFESSPRGARRDNASKTTAPQQDWRAGEVAEWHKRAADLAVQLEQQSPALFRSSEIQFPLAALKRSTGSLSKSDAIFRKFMSRSVDASTRSLAEREVWVMFTTAEAPRSLAVCQPTFVKPGLDGILSDPCWHEAREIRLTTEAPADDAPPESDPTAALVMLAYDAEFLYLGLSVPRLPGAPQDQPQTTGRTHDADLSRHDRVTFCLDVDRDYSTWYEFHVDQRGWTFESCWEDRRWNPVWYVATEADDRNWRIEAAIPWEELVATPPGRGTIWGAAITRTTPTIGIQTWVHPPLIRPAPGSFGLLKFD